MNENFDLPSADDLGHLYNILIVVRQRLAGFNAEWWSKTIFRPSAASDIVVVVSPESEASWHRNEAAKKYRDQIRMQAMKLWRPGLPPLPVEIRNAERDIFDAIAPWLMAAMTPPQPTAAAEPIDKAKRRTVKEWIEKISPIKCLNPNSSLSEIAAAMKVSPSTLTRLENDSPEFKKWWDDLERSNTATGGRFRRG